MPVEWCRFSGWITREPLFLFLLVGGLLFGAQTLLAPDYGSVANPRRIAVDRADLVRFTQLRARAFSEEQAEADFDTLSTPQKRELLDSYLREEALYREARALGLDRHDYVIRRRLVQSLEQAIAAEIDETGVPTEAQARNWFQANPQLYASAPTITFTHVFFRGNEARVRALAALPGLAAGRTEAATTGDRFLYNTNYVEQSASAVAAHFGPAMAERLFAASADGRWSGPYVSPHGVHLVRIDHLAQGGLPPFDAVRDKVMIDLTEANRRQALERRVAEIRQEYRISLSRELEQLR